MKKLLTIACAVSVALTVFGFSACATESSPESVNLVALSGAADVLPREDIDYFVVPEPAASARVKATAAGDSKLNFVGDLQELYGGEKGYPQAVVVAKNELLESDALGRFVSALEESAEWLAAQTTEISAIVDAVSIHLTAGMSATFSDKNLTKAVIENCGIRFESAKDGKAEVKSFLTSLKAVQPAVKDDPADKFFWDGVLPQTTGSLDGISVYAPDGAPALALAGLMAGEVSLGGQETVNYQIVDASTIQTHVSGKADADICILPVNLAANILGTGEKYTMLGTVTHGNLYILSAKTGERITADNIASLGGKTVGVVNLAAVPGLTFKLILNKYNIAYVDPSQAQ